MGGNILFIIMLVLPFIYYRLFFLIFPNYVKREISWRKWLGLNIHHIHYGIVFILIASILVIIEIQKIYILALLGFGLGFMLDDFIPSLLIKSDRKKEIRTYSKSFMPTIILIILIIIIVLVLSF